MGSNPFALKTKLSTYRMTSSIWRRTDAGNGDADDDDDDDDDVVDVAGGLRWKRPSEYFVTQSSLRIGNK